MSLGQVDANLQAIHAIEGSWSLPSLPDEVKLDLAGNALMTPPALAALFQGLSADLHDAEKPQPLPTRSDYGVEEPVNPSYGYKPPSRAGLIVAGLTDLPTPQVYDVQAPQRLKQRLAEGGYLNLTPEQIASPAWLPEYSYAASQLNRDEMSKRFQGNEPGSISVDSILGVVDEWLSPRGLYRAAVELDLWWDAGQIRKEFQEWDDKLAAWREDPLNPRKLIDMVTGPLDDLLFPALNIALLFSGVGAMAASARALPILLKGGQSVAGLYRGGKGLKFLASGADDLARFAQPSFLSGMVGKAGPVGKNTALVMNQWRRNGAVILAKKANQQALRAGFSSNLQQLIDADRGGQSINRFTGGEVGESIDAAFTNNMLLDWGADLLLYPPNIFRPGRFAGPAKAAIERVKNGFLKVTENQDLLAAYNRPLRAILEEEGGKEAVRAFDRLVGSKGMKAALSETFFDSDDEAMGAALAYVTSMAGIDHWARNAAAIGPGGPPHELSSGIRSFFHRARNAAAARLRLLDPDNVEDLLTHITKYGVEPDLVTGSRRADEFQRVYREVKEGYLEAAGASNARGAAIPEGHTRFIGRFNQDLGHYEWRPLQAGDMLEDDPFFVDVWDDELRESLGDIADSVVAGEIDLPEVFANRYLRRDDDGRLRHWVLSEADRVRHYDPEKLATLKAIAQRHNELRAKFLTEVMDSLSPQVLEQYVYEVFPSFGRWHHFVEASAVIDDAVRRGELNDLQFVSPKSEMGRALSALPWTPDERTWVNQLFSMMVELPDDERTFKGLMSSIFAPFARDVDPQMGSVTAAQAETVTKQEALAFAAAAGRTVRMIEQIRRLKGLPQSQEILRVAGELVESTDEVSKAGLREALAEVLGSAAITERTLEDVMGLARLAKQEGVTLDAIEDVLTSKLAEIDALPDWAERYMVPTQLRRTGDSVKEVQAKIAEVQRQAYFMASEVGGAPQQLVDYLAERGYKLVYGVEFAQPFDLEGIMPHFADVRRRHLAQKSLGNFVSRQEPPAVNALKIRKVRDALHARLTKVEDGMPLNLGPKPDPDNADMRRVVDDLYEVLREVQDEARNRLDTAEGPLARVFARGSASQIPFSLDRLPSDLPEETFIRRVMGKGYSRRQAAAMSQALHSAQALGFRTHGLFAVESKLRSSPNLINGTRLLSIAGGSVAGLTAAGYSVSDTEDPYDQNMLLRAGGMLAGGIAGGFGGKAAAGAIQRNMDAGGKALKWAYLADWVANLRDKVRFSLSPIFDASRYSEAIILAQVGELPDGLRNLRVNQSPSSFRAHHARRFRAEGLDPDQARVQADLLWNQTRDEFAAAARGDFEWEVMDGIGRRFSSVGILGFSPADWMSSTFGHLRAAGVDSKKAYETVRDIYTYGMTGRSAAELSMNFVFFPFSFTKKTVGHLSKFFADDLSRLIVVQDMAATYQLLDEHYDLSQEWRDRLPILEKAHRLNLLAYGIGLGRFGGVNAPILDAGFQALASIPGMGDQLEGLNGPEAIVNAFIPQMVPMRYAADADSAWEIARGMLPVINDVNSMIYSLVEQGRVIGSPQHLTRQAEERRAWEEWRAYQAQIKGLLDKSGMTWASAVRRPELAALIQAERTRISLKYPQWKYGLGDGIAHSAAIDMELKERIQAPTSPGDPLLGAFHEIFEQTNSVMTGAGLGSFHSAPENVPPELFDLLRKIAIEYAREEPEFLRLYNRFYRRILGDITSEVTAQG